MRCQYRLIDDTQCRGEATRWMIDPDGKRVPGCAYCRHHAEDTLAEYASKPELVGGRWGAEVIDEYGVRIPVQGELW